MEKVTTDIIFTVTNDLSYDQRMMRICSTLADAGYEVELVGRKLEHSVPLTMQSYKQSRLDCWFSKGKLFYLEYNIRLFFYLLFCNARMLSAVDLDTLLPHTIVSKIRSKKLVFDAHEYFTEVPEVYSRKLTKAIWGTVGRICIPHVDVAYTVGQSLADIFTSKHHKKFEVIRNVPLLTETLVSSRNQKSPIIFYQGDVNEGRGLEQMIRAISSIDAELHIAGDGPLLAELKQLVQSLNVSAKVIFLGYIKPEALPALLSEASIGLNILENNGLSYYYSLSNKFFAYIHAGLPQVCAPFPEYQFINGTHEVAMLCECSTEKLISTINELLQDTDRYNKLQRNCELAKQYYNWQSESKTLIRLYQHVLA
ncbi:MAG: glycosyltransferase [Bacteroidota bacterium]